LRAVADKAGREKTNSFERQPYRAAEEVQAYESLRKARADLREGIEATRRMVAAEFPVSAPPRLRMATLICSRSRSGACGPPETRVSNRDLGSTFPERYILQRRRSGPQDRAAIALILTFTSPKDNSGSLAVVAPIDEPREEKMLQNDQIRCVFCAQEVIAPSWAGHINAHRVSQSVFIPVMRRSIPTKG
jgi:hypothetical protein